MSTREQRYGLLIALMITMAVVAALLPQMLEAQGKSPDHRTYGKGHPKSAQELPPGKLRQQIEALNPKAKGNALKQLQDLSFPVQDVEHMRAGPKGGIMYVDPPPVEPAQAQHEGLPIPPGEVFQLHSRPGSTNVYFIDTDGHRIEGTAWNKNADIQDALCFDPSEDGCAYSDDELADIYWLWYRVAEDYAIFDVDITTEDPVVFTDTMGRLLITENRDANGICIWHCTAGGAAWMDGFGRPYYQPAIVYYNNLSRVASYSEAGAHEIGHNLSLSHDGTSTSSYYYGHGEVSDLTSWAATMGASYYKNVTQWSKGEYPDANNQQDDLAIIAGYLGYLPDEDGVIGIGDTDTFLIDAEKPGTMTVTVTPSWGLYEPQVVARRGSNLNVAISITAPDGTVTEANNPDDTQAIITMSVVAGMYVLNIMGGTDDHFPIYGVQGQYTVETVFNYDPDPPEDNDPPEAVIAFAPQVLEYRKGKGANRGMVITFDGSGSTDLDGDVVAYFWTVDELGVSRDASFVRTMKNGPHQISLLVTDDDGDKGLTAITINVKKLKGKP